MAKIQFRNKAHRDFVFENLENAGTMTAIIRHFLCDGHFRRNQNEYRKNV